MQGQFRLGRWLPMQAVQVLSPPSGLVWLARIGWDPLSFRGFDRYEEERGEMQWRLLGHVPIMHAEGSDVDRSAAGRLAGEAVWTPAAFLDPSVTWRASGDDTVTAEWALGPHNVSTELRVDAGGRLLAVSIRRWGKPAGDPWGEYPFGGAVAEERAFGGMRIPTRMTVGGSTGRNEPPRESSSGSKSHAHNSYDNQRTQQRMRPSDRQYRCSMTLEEARGQGGMLREMYGNGPEAGASPRGGGQQLRGPRRLVRP